MDDESWENDNRGCSNSDDSFTEEDVETETNNGSKDNDSSTEGRLTITEGKDEYRASKVSSCMMLSRIRKEGRRRLTSESDESICSIVCNNSSTNFLLRASSEKESLSR
ncbi:hypothetical protein L2E82_47258 [Cichorium intybus]|uniref:Uncharacterized protein n=1 Tax=Cichorium intybus TaxID=13427 RepID=A0ACB8YWH0_CICIN|nr:hypothetical protein L2E82_47258 [Cichorium intybus]